MSQLLWSCVALLNTAIAVVATVFVWRRSLRQPTFVGDENDLAITVMKPMSGLDPHLEENLETFARLQAPASFEVLLCVGIHTDAAAATAKRFVERHPARFRLVVGTDPRLGNEKMAQLAYAWPMVRNPLVWVSDSNVETSQAFMESLVLAWKQVNAVTRTKTLIHAPLVGIGGSGIGACLERMHLSSFQNPNHETSLLAGLHAVVGKTMFFHRDDLDSLGGFEAFGNYLGEDFMLGKAFAKAGVVRCSSLATRNVLGPTSLRTWVSRHSRWAVLRKTMVPAAFYFLEPINGLVWPTALWLAGLVPLSVWLVALAARIAIDTVNYSLQTREAPRLLDVALIPLKELMMLVCWVGAFFTFHVKWREDRAIRLGAKSMVLSKTANVSKLKRHAETLRRVWQGDW